MGPSTQHLMVDLSDLHSTESLASLSRAARIIKSGGIVAFPTETVYGLGANALNEAAVARIFEAKQRPAWDPLIVHVSDEEMLLQVARGISACARSLMDAFWPAPLTLLVPKHPDLHPIVTAGRPRVGVRMPAHPVAIELLRTAGVPIAAPSANLFGHVSPTSASHVLDDLNGRIDAVLDGGETQHGLESTVVDTCETPAIVYRPGVISLEQIAAVCGPADAFDMQNGAGSMNSPGMALRHYAPRARLILIEGEGAAQHSAFYKAVAKARQDGGTVGLMLPVEFDRRSSTRLEPRSGLIYQWGRLAAPDELAHRLFAGLRQLDAAGAKTIVCPLPPAIGLGVAIRDRLRRAAAHQNPHRS
ncbi:MAG TPA: L-threonylcarbamoyladenylate synthase [Acidisarcina sp.]